MPSETIKILESLVHQWEDELCAVTIEVKALKELIKIVEKEIEKLKVEPQEPARTFISRLERSERPDWQSFALQTLATETKRADLKRLVDDAFPTVYIGYDYISRWLTKQTKAGVVKRVRKGVYVAVKDHEENV